MFTYGTCLLPIQHPRGSQELRDEQQKLKCKKIHFEKLYYRGLWRIFTGRRGNWLVADQQPRVLRNEVPWLHSHPPRSPASVGPLTGSGKGWMIRLFLSFHLRLRLRLRLCLLYVYGRTFPLEFPSSLRLYWRSRCIKVYVTWTITCQKAYVYICV